MLRIFSGNRLENLLAVMGENIRQTPPLEKVPVCIQTPGMQRWIGLQLAGMFGVSANLDFIFPGALMKRLAGVGAGEKAPWPEKEELIWRIFSELLNLPDAPVFATIRTYLADDTGHIKSYRLAKRIADTFDQYQIYRPEMVLGWLSPGISHLPEDEGDHWQPELFRSVFPDHKKCKTYVFDKYLKLKSHPAGPAVHIFGVSVLPRFFMDMLKAASKERDICLYLLNPSQEYWGDSKTLRQKRWLEKRYQDSVPENHELLDNLGVTGRDFFDHIQGSDDPQEYFESFEPITRDSVLSAVQADILELRYGGGKYGADGSVIINSCHNPMREAETLYDTLLSLFDSDKELKPSDILVMTPDIEKYSPYIRAVFDNPYSERERIPYSVADVSERLTSRPAGVFLELIEALRGDFSLSDAFRLLSSELVSGRFGIPQSSLETLSAVLERTGAFWGHNREHLAENGLEIDGLFTWERALRRVAIGLAEGSTFALYNDAAGADIPFSMADEIGGVMRFADSAASFASELRDEKSAAEWCGLLSKAAADFLSAPFEMADDMLYLEKCVSRIAEESADFRAKIPFEPVYERITELLSETRGAKGFISGRVTFCAMLPMRSIPFKVICIIGLNENTFPRQKVSLEFDLIAQHPKPGDRNNRDSDRYLFLETLVSARRRLILSYTGQSERDNSALPPSALITELLEHMKKRFGIDDITIKQRLHSFSRHYFMKGELFTYSAERFEAAKAFSSERVSRAFSGAPVPADEPEEVRLEDFERFFISPAAHFMKRVLGVNPDPADETLPETEVMNLDNLLNYALVNGAVAESLAGEDPLRTLDYLAATAQLPPENLGRYSIGEVKKAADAAFEKSMEKLGGYPSEAEIDTIVNGLRIRGKIPGVNGGRHVYIKPSSIKPKDLIRGWIRHLLLNGMRPTESCLLGTKGELTIPPVKTDALNTLTSMFKAGQKSPLRFHISDASENFDWGKKPVDKDANSNMAADYSCRICFGKDAVPDAKLVQEVLTPVSEALRGEK